MTTTSEPTATAPAAAANTETFMRLAPAVIDPDPENRTASVDAELRKSVKEHGVLEPVLVVPHPDSEGRYLLVAGERRWRAATDVGCDDIPALVTIGLTDIDRVVRQISENLHRLDLAPAAEAQQFIRLAKLGMSVRDLAREVSRSQRYVRDRLRIAELPAVAQKLIDNRQWSIEDGLAAAQLLDQPELLAGLVADVVGNVPRRVDLILAEQGREATVRALVEQAQADGLNLVKTGSRQRELTALGISDADHAGEDCHGWIVQVPGFGTPKLVPVCTQPKAHSTRGASEVKANATTRQDVSEAEAARYQSSREARAGRLEAIAFAVAGKVTKAQAASLILPALLDAISAEDAKKAAKALGIEGDKDTSWPTALREHAATSDAALHRAALSVALMAGNRQIQNGWSDPYGLGQRAADFLESLGWKPTPHDRDRLKALRTTEA